MGATLQPVSFKKPRGHAPRLSAPYVPGRHSSRFWTDAERQVLRDHFSTKGAQYCRARLPQRSTTAIYAEAHKLRLKGKGAPEKRQRHPTDGSLDPEIRAAWPLLAGKGAVNRLADELDVPRWWLSKRACVLGLTIPRIKKEPPWCAAEDALMARVPLHDPDRCAAIFAEHGFRRTPAAIVMRAKRLDMSRRYTATFSATRAAKVLGVDAKSFTNYIAKGLIAATKRPTQRSPQQGGDPWSIARDELRRFILDRLEMIDFRKVDKFAIVDLLTASPAPASSAAKGAELRPRKSRSGGGWWGCAARASPRDRTIIFLADDGAPGALGGNDLCRAFSNQRRSASPCFAKVMFC